MNIHEPIYPGVIAEEFVSWFTHMHRLDPNVITDPVNAINNGYCYVLAYALQQEGLYRCLESDIVRVRGHWFYRERHSDGGWVYYDAFMIGGTRNITDIVDADDSECEVWSCDKILELDRYKVLSYYSKFWMDRLDKIRRVKLEHSTLCLRVGTTYTVDIIFEAKEGKFRIGKDNINGNKFSDSSKLSLYKAEEVIITILKLLKHSTDDFKTSTSAYDEISKILVYALSPCYSSLRVQLIEYLDILRQFPFPSQHEPLRLGTKEFNLTIAVR